MIVLRLRHDRARSGFTLVELLITISIIAIMASMALFALFGAQEAAKVQKTKSLIAKLDAIIKDRWASYNTRRIPISFIGADPPLSRAKKRLDCLRDLMRMEMPDRWNDVQTSAVTPLGTFGLPTPATYYTYNSRLGSQTPDLQGAECLYMIVTQTLGELGDLAQFKANEVGDTDGDGFPEFLDGWGRPIRFLRWAPGFQSDLQTPVKGKPLSVSGSSTVTITMAAGGDASGFLQGAVAVLDSTGQIDTTKIARITGLQVATNGVATITCTVPMGNAFVGGAPTMNDTIVLMPPDPFDVRHVYPLFTGTPEQRFPSVALYPLIWSMGPDGESGIVTDLTVGLDYTTHQMNPMVSTTDNHFVGAGMKDTTDTSEQPWLDNIHNHQLNLR